MGRADATLEAGAVTIASVLKRLDTRDDPWKTYFHAKQRLPELKAMVRQERRVRTRHRST